MRIFEAILIGILLVLATPLASAFDDEYLWQNYLKADETYGNTPINRFRNLGAVVNTNETPEHVTFWAIKHGLKISEGFSSPDSQLFRVRFLEMEKDSLVGKYFENYVYVSGTATYFPAVEFITEDMEVGGYDRTVWDVFELEGKEFLLVFNRIYESHNFELYEASNGALKLVSFFEFGGL